LAFRHLPGASNDNSLICNHLYVSIERHNGSQCGLFTVGEQTKGNQIANILENFRSQYSENPRHSRVGLPLRLDLRNVSRNGNQQRKGVLRCGYFQIPEPQVSSSEARPHCIQPAWLLLVSISRFSSCWAFWIAARRFARRRRSALSTGHCLGRAENIRPAGIGFVLTHSDSIPDSAFGPPRMSRRGALTGPT
jgi:hypothetical protein